MISPGPSLSRAPRDMLIKVYRGEPEMGQVVGAHPEATQEPQ
jgi:hypothetical protein